MPIYLFECRKCKESYEELTDWDARGKYPGVQCPACKSKRKRQLLHPIGAIIFTNPRGTCKENNFDYVAKQNMEWAKDERRRAESASTAGNNPYNPIDDISGGEYFGEVK